MFNDPNGTGGVPYQTEDLTGFRLTLPDYTNAPRQCFCTGKCRENGICPNTRIGTPYLPEIPFTSAPLPQIDWPNILKEKAEEMPCGWLCPRCQKVNAPHIAACDCKPEGTP